MKRNIAISCVLMTGLAGTTASAQDYGDGSRDASMFHINAEISASIVGFAGGDWHTLNSNPDASIPRSTFDAPMFVPIGEIEVDTTGDTDNVEAAWWHQNLAGEDYIRFVLRTENGNEFVPFGSKTGGSTIQAYSYELGGNGNGIDFRWWVQHVDWQELTISYSYDGGQTVFSDPTINDPIGGANWDGIDDLHLGLALPGDGVNWIQASYKVTAVPAPASAFALLGAGALGLRRRRS